MAEDVVFFSRCRPTYSDPIDLAVREKRIFIGWPAWRQGIERRRGHLRDTIIDLWCPDNEWEALRPEFGPNGRYYQQNRNFVRSIKPGAIALIPRTSRGVVYTGRVTEQFKLLDDPPWGDEYLNLRREQGLEADPEPDYLADVAQCCKVDRFRAIPFSAFPAWIRRSLLGRSTYGQVKPILEHGLDPYSVLDRLLDKPEQAERGWTQDIIEAGRRIIDAVGPNTLEHLCVALLQLEHPEQVWMHVGGSGDGGVDGVGADANGSTVGILQCKWAYQGGDVFAERSTAHSITRQILAALLHPEGVQVQDGVEFWPLTYIASLVIKHANRLPLATSLRIKQHHHE